jgi:hypothetical protein
MLDPPRAMGPELFMVMISYLTEKYPDLTDPEGEM